MQFDARGEPISPCVLLLVVAGSVIISGWLSRRFQGSPGIFFSHELRPWMYGAAWRTWGE